MKPTPSTQGLGLELGFRLLGAGEGGWSFHSSVLLRVLRGGGILTAEGPNWLPSSAPSGHRLQRELAVSKPIGTARRAAPSPPKLRIPGRRAAEFSARRSLRGPGHHVTGDLTRWTRPGPWRRERHEPPRVSAARPADVLEPSAAAQPGAPGCGRLLRAPGAQTPRLGRAPPARVSGSEKRRLSGFPSAPSLPPWGDLGFCGPSSARGPLFCVAGTELSLVTSCLLLQRHSLPLDTLPLHSRAARLS